MSTKQPGGVGLYMVANRRQDIRLEELDTLSQVINGPPNSSASVDIDGDLTQDPVTSYLETFLTSAQLGTLDKAKEGSMVRDSKEEAMWFRMQSGILLHPAIIGKLANLSGVGHLTDVGEGAWKDQGDCKEDIRFVSSGSHRSLKEIQELMDICENCPVLAECSDHVAENSLQYGFWAGVARGGKAGYHDDGTPVTLAEKREMMEAKETRAS